MARMTRLTGACPVCDRDVPRTVQYSSGLQKETFRCPTHGALEYTPHHVPLAMLTRFAIGTPSRAQPLTGLEMVL